MMGKSLVATIMDEQAAVSSHTLDALAYCAQMAQTQAQLAAATAYSTPVPRVRSINVPCRRCGAPVGEKCVQWQQRRSRQLYKPHRIRVPDAAVANEALDALNPR